MGSKIFAGGRRLTNEKRLCEPTERRNRKDAKSCLSIAFQKKNFSYEATRRRHEGFNGRKFHLRENFLLLRRENHFLECSSSTTRSEFARRGHHRFRQCVRKRFQGGAIVRERKAAPTDYRQQASEKRATFSSCCAWRSVGRTVRKKPKKHEIIFGWLPSIAGIPFLF